MILYLLQSPGEGDCLFVSLAASLAFVLWGLHPPFSSTELQDTAYSLRQVKSKQLIYWGPPSPPSWVLNALSGGPQRLHRGAPKAFLWGPQGRSRGPPGLLQGGPQGLLRGAPGLLQGGPQCLLRGAPKAF